MSISISCIPLPLDHHHLACSTHDWYSIWLVENVTPRGSSTVESTDCARRLSLYRAPAIFLHICISVSVSLVCTDDETDKGEGLGRRDDMQRDESCSTFILTTKVLPTLKNCPLVQEANSIAQLNSKLTSLLSFLVFKSEFFSTVNLNREVNWPFNWAIEMPRL